MVGAGIFSALGPAAEAAGSGVLVALLLAAVVAYCNATSSAQLAAIYPESGGTYIYGQRRLSEFWGFLAGWGFVIGKVASCAAIALTFGAYVDGDAARPLAAAVVIVLTAVNYMGVEKTAFATTALVAVVLASLVVVVAACWGGGATDPDRLTPVLGDAGARGILEAAGLLFFAFAGYARIATLGEEVRDPERTIPAAIPRALAITLLVYAVVAISVLLVVGPEIVAEADAPLVVAVEAGDLDEASPVVQIGAAVASLSVLLSLLAGVSRTSFSMAANGHLPRWLDAVHPTRRIPHHAELMVGALVITLVLALDLRQAIGFSSFAVLVYYAIANASAFTLSGTQRRWPRWLTVLGLAGCMILAFSLPWESVVAGASLLALGAVVYGLLFRRSY
jgi:APA family basic amino acid/polyamine antiporter